jgi:ubiquinone/menaquinone biosynthesis C-methylase UbiE
MFSDPVQIIEKCSIHPGLNIADLGAGSGHFSLAAAKAMHTSGRVYAVDVHKDLLSKLKNHAAHEGLHNIEVIWGDIEKLNGTKLREFSIDLCFLCNVLFQVEDKKGLITEVKRILKPTVGRVLLVDWAESFGGTGPTKEMVVKKEKALEFFEKAGFHLDREIPAGAHHYGLIFKKL